MSNISVRLDEDTKREAKEILDDLGLSLSQAVKLFLKQVIHQKGIPLDIKLPNRETVETFTKTDKGEGLREVSSVDELMEELNR